jgi:hypothetical protein
MLQGRAVAGHSAAVLCWRSVSAHFYQLPIRLYTAGAQSLNLYPVSVSAHFYQLPIRAQSLNLYHVSCILYPVSVSAHFYQLPIRLYSRSTIIKPVSCILYQILLTSTSFRSGYTAEHNHLTSILYQFLLTSTSFLSGYTSEHPVTDFRPL